MEWDNPRTSAADRALEAFRRIADQMRAHPASGELLVVYARGVFDEDSLRRALCGQANALELRLIGTPGLRYYELKNQGVLGARGRLVVFVDSDLLIEPGWLAAMLAPFSDPAVECVCGSARLEHETLYEKSLALAWTFPARAAEAAPLRPTRHFFANSVAARRELWLRFPFAAEQIRYRGMCADVARSLRRSGVTLWSQPAARGVHPPPRGVRHFVARGLAEGHDRALKLRRTRGPARSLAALLYWFVRKTRDGARRVVRDRGAVGLPLAAIPLSLAIVTAYFALGLAGGLVTLARPGLVRRSLQEQPRPGF
jgi:hypothetical protein